MARVPSHRHLITFFTLKLLLGPLASYLIRIGAQYLRPRELLAPLLRVLCALGAQILRRYLVLRGRRLAERYYHAHFHHLCDIADALGDLLRVHLVGVHLAQRRRLQFVHIQDHLVALVAEAQELLREDLLAQLVVGAVVVREVRDVREEVVDERRYVNVVDLLVELLDVSHEELLHAVDLLRLAHHLLVLPGQVALLPVDEVVREALEVAAARVGAHVGVARRELERAVVRAPLVHHERPVRAAPVDELQRQTEVDQVDAILGDGLDARLPLRPAPLARLRLAAVALAARVRTTLPMAGRAVDRRLGRESTVVTLGMSMLAFPIVVVVAADLLFVLIFAVVHALDGAPQVVRGGHLLERRPLAVGVHLAAARRLEISGAPLAAVAVVERAVAALFRRLRRSLFFARGLLVLVLLEVLVVQLEVAALVLLVVVAAAATPARPQGRLGATALRMAVHGGSLSAGGAAARRVLLVRALADHDVLRLDVGVRVAVVVNVLQNVDQLVGDDQDVLRVDLAVLYYGM